MQTQDVKLLVSSSTYFETMTWNMNAVCWLWNNTVSKSTVTQFQNAQAERDLGDHWIWNSTFTYKKTESWVSLRRNNSLIIDTNQVTELITIRTRIKPRSLWTYLGVSPPPHWIRSSLTLRSYFKHFFISLYQHQYQFSHSVVSDSLRPPKQHARPPCPSPTLGVYSNSCPMSWWCHPAISSSVISFSSCPQSLPASGSFPMTQLYTWGGQSIGVSASASVLPMNTQDWSPSGWTGWISLQPKEFWRVFNTTVQKHQFFSAQLSL